MKKIFVTLFILLTSVASLAEGVCENKAIRVAKENSSGSTLYYIESLPTKKTYLVSYRVAIRDSDLSEASEDVFDIILMNSSCSIVSLIRRF